MLLLFSWILFGDTTPAESVGIGGGAAGLLSAGYAVFLHHQHRSERKEWGDALARLMESANKTYSELLTRVESVEARNREEWSRRTDQILSLNREAVAALEHVSNATNESRRTMLEMQTVLRDLVSRIGQIETDLKDRD